MPTPAPHFAKKVTTGFQACFDGKDRERQGSTWEGVDRVAGEASFLVEITQRKKSNMVEVDVPGVFEWKFYAPMSQISYSDLAHQVMGAGPERSCLEIDKASVAIGAINGCLEIIPALIGSLKLVSRDEVTGSAVQVYILATWRLWFSFQTLDDILRQNAAETFLSESQAKTAATAKAILREIGGEIMPKICEHTGFKYSTELYNLTEIHGYKLKSPFLGSLDVDGDGFIAKCFEVPQVYGYGDSRDEAKANLLAELASLYDDLAEDDNFSEEFLAVKNLFAIAVADG